VPNDARASTGYGTPVLTPALPTSVISQKMTREPTPIPIRNLAVFPATRNRLAARK
jgi:hypothetical protein